MLCKQEKIQCQEAYNNTSISETRTYHHLKIAASQGMPVTNNNLPIFLEAFCDISHRLGGITPFGVFSDAFQGLKMWVTFACATANFSTHFIISIAVLENVPPDAGLQKRATFPH
jgi:hypothetical protein